MATNLFMVFKLSDAIGPKGFLTLDEAKKVASRNRGTLSIVELVSSADPRMDAPISCEHVPSEASFSERACESPS